MISKFAVCVYTHHRHLRKQHVVISNCQDTSNYHVYRNMRNQISMFCVPCKRHLPNKQDTHVKVNTVKLTPRTTSEDDSLQFLLGFLEFVFPSLRKGFIPQTNNNLTVISWSELFLSLINLNKIDQDLPKYKSCCFHVINLN